MAIAQRDHKTTRAASHRTRRTQAGPERPPHRIFLLSPANAGGIRAKMIMSENATFHSGEATAQRRAAHWRTIQLHQRFVFPRQTGLCADLCFSAAGPAGCAGDHRGAWTGDSRNAGDARTIAGNCRRAGGSNPIRVIANRWIAMRPIYFAAWGRNAKWCCWAALLLRNMWSRC